jgi:hypothetical protein
MIISFEITYGKYSNETSEMFKETDEKHEIIIPREQPPVHVIEIE